MRTIAIINQKGGVGKTTTTANLAHALAMSDRRVTAIDLDPQGHLGASLGLNGTSQEGVDRILLAGGNAVNYVIEARERLQIIPAGNQLADVERTQNGLEVERLHKAIRASLGDQDLVLIDCPPSTGKLVDQGLTAAQVLLVPVVGDYLSLRGLSYLTGILKDFVTRSTGPVGQRLAVTRFHSRRRLSHEAVGILMKHFPDMVLATPIRECVALAEAPSHGKTIFEYKNRSNGAEDHRNLAADLLNGRTM